jgi:hypothetical protein
VFKQVAMADHERHPALFLADVDMAEPRPGVLFKPWDELEVRAPGLRVGDFRSWWAAL